MTNKNFIMNQNKYIQLNFFYQNEQNNVNIHIRDSSFKSFIVSIQTVTKCSNEQHKFIFEDSDNL